MKPERLDLLWSGSLFAVGITAVIFAVSRIVGFELPDVVKGIMGIIDITGTFLFVYSTAKKFM